MRTLDEIMIMQHEVNQDSRGFNLSINDYVFYIAKVTIDLPLLCKIRSLNNTLSIVDKKGQWHVDRDAYVLKVTQPYNLYKDRHMQLCEVYKTAFSYKADFDINDFRRISANKEELWKKNNNKTNIVEMIACDYFDRTLKVGSLVAYLDTDWKQVRYGVLISDKMIYTQDFKKKRVKHVLALDTLTKEEKYILQSLSMRYKEEIQKSNMNKGTNYKVGDVYASKAIAYVYLGKIAVQVIDKSTNAKYRLKDKEYWLKVPIDTHSAYELQDVLEKAPRYTFESIFRRVLELSFVEKGADIAFNSLGTKARNINTHVGRINLKKSYEFMVVEHYIVHISLLDM